MVFVAFETKSEVAFRALEGHVQDLVADLAAELLLRLYLAHYVSWVHERKDQVFLIHRINLFRFLVSYSALVDLNFLLLLSLEIKLLQLMLIDVLLLRLALPENFS